MIIDVFLTASTLQHGVEVIIIFIFWRKDETVAFSVNCEAILGLTRVILVQSISLSKLQKNAENVTECPLTAPKNQANLGNYKHRPLFCLTFLCFWSQFHDFWGAGSGFLTCRSWLCILFAIRCVLNSIAFCWPYLGLFDTDTVKMTLI